jgi:alpha-tubulin suppressor-like RCC1 family protein
LGDGSFVDRTTPVQISENVTRIEARLLHSAILRNGQLYTFGYNSVCLLFLTLKNGQLGDNTTLSRPNLTLVSNFYNITDVSTGSYHTLFVTQGNVYGMGRNDVNSIHFNILSLVNLVTSPPMIDSLLLLFLEF